MRALVLIGLAFVLLPLAWSRLAPPVVYMENWPDGSAKVRAVSTRTADGEYVFDGEYTAYHESGRKEREGRMRGGKEEGAWTWWNEDGSVRARGDFHRGSGPITLYHPGGAVRWQGQYRDGLREGVWTEYSPEGRKLREGPYRMDREDGVWTYWATDGSPDSLVVQWQDGRRLGEDETVTATPVDDSLEAPWRQALRLLAWWWILLAPLPLSWVVARDDAFEGHRASATAVTWCAAQIALVLVLGELGWLQLTAVLIGESLLLVGGLALGRNSRLEWPTAPGFSSAPVRAMAFCGCVTALACFWWILSIPTANFDSLAYHLPTVVRWLQEGRLLRLSELGQVSYYPFHWEALAVLQMLPLGGDLTVAVPNLLAWALLTLSVVALARDLGADRVAAWFAALALAVLPAILSRLPAIQPDLAVAAFFVASAAMGRIALRRPSWTTCLVWGLSLGMLVGLKGSGLAYAILAVVFASEVRILDRRADRPRWGWRWTLFTIAVALTLGGVWYARNLAQTGNPLGFVRVDLFGATLWPGSVDAASLRRGTLMQLFDPLRAEHWRLLVGMITDQLGIVFAALVLGVFAVWRPATRQAFGLRRVGWVTGWALAAFLLYWVTPYSGDNGAEGWQLTSRMQAGLRFGFPALAAGSVVAALGLSRLRASAWPLVAVLALSIAWSLVHEVEAGWRVLGAASALALAAFALPLSRRAVRIASMGAVVVLVTAVMLGARGERDRWRSTLYGEAYEFVERTVPRDDVIGYALTQTRFPYYGRHLDRRLVSAVPANASYDEWLAALRSQGVRWLLLGTTNSGEESTSFEPLARQWAQAHPDRFEPAFDYQSKTRDITVLRLLD